MRGALLSIEAETGYVKAMIGGRDYLNSQFNRAIQSRRQPGSAFKPIVFASAIDRGYTSASMIIDSPIVYDDSSDTLWKPNNYSEKFYGPTLLRHALAKSRNVVTIKIVQDIGIDAVISYARRLGITSPMGRNLSVSLGASGLSLLELVNAYSVFYQSGVSGDTGFYHADCRSGWKYIGAFRFTKTKGDWRRYRLHHDQHDGERRTVGNRLADQSIEAAGCRKKPAPPTIFMMPCFWGLRRSTPPASGLGLIMSVPWDAASPDPGQPARSGLSICRVPWRENRSGRLMFRRGLFLPKWMPIPVCCRPVHQKRSYWSASKRGRCQRNRRPLKRRSLRLKIYSNLIFNAGIWNNCHGQTMRIG